MKKETLRYIDNGDGTISDTLTGLMWLQNDKIFCGEEGHPQQAAKVKARTFKFAGHNDWRVPGYYELISIVDFDGKNGLLNELFKGHRGGYFWTSQTYVPNTTNAMVVGFNGGNVIVGTKTAAYYVRPVRGGPWHR